MDALTERHAAVLRGSMLVPVSNIEDAAEAAAGVTRAVLLEIAASCRSEAVDSHASADRGVWDAHPWAEAFEAAAALVEQAAE